MTIYTLYASGDFLHRPCMKQALQKAMKREQFAFTAQFLDLKPLDGNIFFRIVNRIKQAAEKAFFLLRMISSSYRTKFFQAVEVVQDQYEQKQDLDAILDEALQDIESDEDPISSEVTEVRQEPTESAYECFLQDFKESGHKDLADVLKVWFEVGQGKERILSWKLDPETNRGILKNRQPIRIWMPSYQLDGREDPKGGVVMIAGEQVIIQFSENKIEFLAGFDIYCKPDRFGVREATVSLDYLEFRGRENIVFAAGKRKEITLAFFGLGFSLTTRTFEERRTFDYLKRNWEVNGVDLTLHDDYKRYLNQKYQNSNLAASLSIL